MLLSRSRARRTKRGVSTTIGMAMFMLIFALTIANMFIFSQRFVSYVEASKQEADFQIQRAQEYLIVIPTGTTSAASIQIINPTAQLVLVTQIWSDNQVLEDTFVVPAFGKKIVEFQSPLTNNGNFSVVTSRGNIFAGMVLT